MQRSQIRLQIQGILAIHIDLVGAQLQMVNIRDLTTCNAILFHSGNDPFTPCSLGCIIKCKSILWNLGAHSYLPCCTYNE